MLQAGGHQLMKLQDGFIVKPTKSSEVQFYQTYLNRYPSLSKFVPKFHKTGLTSEIKHLFTTVEYKTIIEKKYTHYIALENLTPTSMNVIDLKLGCIHWRSDASTESIENHKNRNRLSITNRHKFRLDGAIIDNITYHKEDCRNMTIDDVKSIISTIPKPHINTINDWINKLSKILSDTDLNIYGPSMLIMYDHANVTIKLIDFTTYETSHKRRDDILESLKSIRNLLNN